MKNIEYGFPYVDMANAGILRGVCRITKFIVSLSPVPPHPYTCNSYGLILRMLQNEIRQITVNVSVHV